MSSKQQQENVVANLNNFSKSPHISVATVYPSPPNSPPPSLSKVSKAEKVLEDEPFPSSGAISPSLPAPSSSSLQHTSNAVTEEKKLVEDKVRMTAPILKALLGLDGWRCGYLKRDKAHCGSWVKKEKRGRINSQIEAMVNLTKSSKELESELDKLAVLVHCFYHDDRPSRQARISTWVKAFPGIDDNIDPAKTASNHIRETLGEISILCIGFAEDKPCESRVGGQKVQNCTRTINEITRPEVHLDDNHLEELLEVLEANMYCSEHSNQRYKRVESWKASIIEIREKVYPDLALPIRDSTPQSLEGQPEDLTLRGSKSPSMEESHSLVLHHPRLLTPRDPQSLSSEHKQDPAKYWPEACDITPFDIICPSDPLSLHTSSYELVQKVLRKDLVSKDPEDGYIYAYEVEGNKGYVKIGYTSRSTEARRSEWAFNCNRKSIAVYPVHPDTDDLVPNARRIEALCHAELNHRRIRIHCTGCLKQHLEWFEISAEEAILVIRKWTKWMTTSPYQSFDLRAGRKWTLRVQEYRKTSSIHQFMQGILAASTSTVASGLRLKKSEITEQKHLESSTLT